MQHRLARVRALVLSSALALACLLVAAPPATAAACSGSTGVTVIVQSGSGTRIGCASGDPSSGLAALQGAGFNFSFVQNNPGAVCRIDGYPAAGEQCWQPPHSWSYWYADRGGSWTYSSQGAGNRNPRPGTVDGWHFGSGPPSTNPPAAVAPPAPKPSIKPKTKSKTKHQPAVSASATVSASASASASPSASATSSSTPSAKPTPTAPVATPNPDRGVGAAAAAGPATQLTNATETSDGGVSWLWGLALIGVLGLGGALTWLRRRP